MVISRKGGQVVDKASVYLYILSLTSLKGPTKSCSAPMAGDKENDGRRTYESFKQVDVYTVRGYTRVE